MKMELNRENLREKIEKVLTTTAGERDRILNNRGTISRGELEISKTVISANKNIVTAVMVAKSLLTDDEDN
jgi:hypothetical protein